MWHFTVLNNWLFNHNYISGKKGGIKLKKQTDSKI